MYSVGSLFYAIYFFVSFPMFMRIEEDPKGHKWSLGEVSGAVRAGVCAWLPSRQGLEVP